MTRLPRMGRWMAVAAALSACSSREDVPRQNRTAAANVVSLTATEYALEAPDTIPAGWTTLRLHNHGQEVHYGHMVRLGPGRTAQELLAAYAEAIRTSGPRPEWMTRFGGPGGAAPGDSSSVTQQLEPGSYVWICPVEDSSGTPHFVKGEFRPFVIAAASAKGPPPPAAPSADVVVRLMDYAFAVDSVPAGQHTIRVINAGAQAHDLVMFKLAPGKTAADLAAALNPERARRAGGAAEPPPPLESLGTGAGGIAAIAPGMESFFEARWGPGEYALVCMATAPDGRAHIEHGMIKQIHVYQ